MRSIEPSGDQRAGYDIKLTFPFSRQPLQIYTEAAAEDSVGIRPVQWAYIYGVYLPRILSLERLEFRYEWTETYDRHEPGSWYTHHSYRDGHTYKDRIIGHHMGTNSRDNFVDIIRDRQSHVFLRNAVWQLEEHAISTPVREKKGETVLKGTFALTDSVDLNLSFSLGRIKNPGNAAGDTFDLAAITAGVVYKF